MKRKIGIIVILTFIGIIYLCIDVLWKNFDAKQYEESNVSETGDATVLGNDQTSMAEERTCEIILPEEEAEFWGADYILEIKFGYGDYATQEDIIHIGQCSNLKHLNISINESEVDLSPLGNLSELESLDIKIVCSPDLSFLCNLTELRELTLDIYTLEALDLSPVGSLTELKRFSMYQLSNEETDLSFLKNLNQLTEITFIQCDIVRDLSYFQDMLCLQDLYITYVDDVDLNYLSKLTNLETLTITGQNIRNIEGISNLINLKELSLSDNNWESWYQETEPLDLQLLESLTKLERIDLECIHVNDITPLADLKSLCGITLVNTNVEDISPLIDLENLNSLYIFGNESALVKEQAETYFSEIEDMLVTEELPGGY